MRIYGDIQSGNCYKIEWSHVDILAGEIRRPEYLELNPNGKIPLLQLDDGRCLAESNAILSILAEGGELLPADRYLRAQVLQWQFFEQYSHEPYIAAARFIAKYLGLPEERRAEYQGKQQGGYREVMETQLAKTAYPIGDALSIADISLYGYTHVADQGGFELDRFPAIRVWLERIQSTPGYIGTDAP